LRKDRTLHVLVNAVHAKSGGGVTYLRCLLGALAGSMTLDLAVGRGQDELLAELAPVARGHVLPAPAGLAALALWEQAAIPRLFARLGCDVVLSPANYGPLAVRRQVIVLQNALAVSGEDRRLGKRAYWAALTAMTAASLMAARRSIAISDYVARSIPNPPGATTPVVIPHGVAPEFSPGPGPRGDFLLAVGDLYVQKNLHRLIAAFALLRRERPALRLEIAGAPLDPDYARQLHALVEAHDLAGAIRFLGRRTITELIELYRSCAVFIFPSTVEAFGLPLLEAMACGAPVASSRTTAMPEIGGDAVAWFDPYDAADMARTVTRLLDDATTRTELSRRAVERAALFTWQKSAAATAVVLEEAAG
jgi:glycosyltransferase involved in cell wall biosynthesis